MSVRKPKISSTTGMFGTTVTMATKDGKFSQTLAENLQFDPLKKRVAKVDGGYLFRSPKIEPEMWAETLKTMSNIDGPFQLTAELHTEGENDHVTGFIRFSERDDAALFAWANVELWQKWSDEKESEAAKEAKLRKKPIKATVGKDGKIRVKVTVNTLGT